MRRYKVEDNKLNAKPTMYITLHEEPYTTERILHRTGWLTKDCTITEIYREPNDQDN
tara:strand:- start:82 stop:252 length:171 start_codon:yes stop_codon:yes gene_type:complete